MSAPDVNFEDKYACDACSKFGRLCSIHYRMEHPEEFGAGSKVRKPQEKGTFNRTPLNNNQPTANQVFNQITSIDEENNKGPVHRIELPPLVVSGETQDDDKEMIALGRCVRSLSGLDLATRGRILAYLNNRFGA